MSQASRVSLMKKVKVKLFWLCLLMGFVQAAHAMQVIKMRDGETQTARISLKEVSRIAVEGARLRSVVGTRGDFDVQVDQEIGQVFVRPVTGASIKKPINIFVTDDKGRTFGLILKPEDIPAVSVIISVPRHLEKGRKKQDAPYISEIKDLVRAMANNEVDVYGYEVVDHMMRVPIWNEVELTLERTWVGELLIGERYTLVNVSGSELRLAEQEFMRKGVLAIAIDNAILGPLQSTGLYVVREAIDGGQ